MGTFVPNTKEQQLEMLREIGYEKLDDLFAHIPDDVKFQGELDLPAGMSEMEVAAEMQKIADKNVIYQSIFRGAGAYKHYIPAIVGSVISNETLQTAYTPYQAEISQGVLQSIFEYQTMICDLTGMDVSNASVYDGATAAGEAVAMCRERKQNKALISGAIQPSVMKVIETYCFGNEMELEVIEVKDGKTDLDDLKAKMSDEIACVYIQHPNYFGNLEDAAEIGEIAHSFKKCKYIMGVNPISLGILKTPREYGADFAVGEGQPLGLPIAFVLPVMRRKMGQKNMCQAGFLVQLLGCIFFLIAGKNILLVCIGTILWGVGAVPFTQMLNMMIVDCADYNEMVGKPRMEGTLGSVFGLTRKIGAALATLVAGILLSAVHYDTTLPLGIDNPAALLMIRMMMSVVPALFTIVEMLLMNGYHLDDLLKDWRKKQETGIQTEQA